jgi:hypothetical protein
LPTELIADGEIQERKGTKMRKIVQIVANGVALACDQDGGLNTLDTPPKNYRPILLTAEEQERMDDEYADRYHEVNRDDGDNVMATA